MVLAARTRLGSYEILAPLGAGGMGHVYKARDIRLDRLVAIKVLSRVDADLKARFGFEAKAIGALTHPHICTLYDVGQQDGTDFLVMEYLEGQTLAERLSEAPLPVNVALRYALEIAAALERAHGAGVVHRDLKPANVMITKDGAKLLDFGLAKLRERSAGDATATMMAAELTQQGMIAGTLPYMAPEQLEGKPVDHRTDVWAFGCVMHEMITGRRVFHGQTQASLIGAILHDEPTPMRIEQPLTPALLDRVVARCLAKNPDSRWQTISDLVEVLNWTAEDTSPSVAAGRNNRARWPRMAWGSLVLAAIATLALGFLFFPREAHLPLTRLDVVTPPTSDPFAFALSPDGRQLVFAAPADGVSKLWLRPLDQAEAKPLPDSDSASVPFWSPDSRSIGFFADGKLKRLDLRASVSQILAAAPEGRGGAWESNNTIVFAPATASPLFRVPASGGTPVAVTRLDPKHEISHRWPQALSDGRLLFFVLSFGNVQPSGTYLASPDGTGLKRLLSGDSGAAYAPPGYLLLADQGILVARSVNMRKDSVDGPVPIAQRIGTDQGIWRSAFSVSNVGVLAYRTVSSARRQLVWVDRAGKRVGAVGDIDENSQSSPALSPDGHRVATQRTALGAPHTWIFESGREVPIRFRHDATPDGRAVWTPDGKRLAFLTALDGRQALVEKPINGSARDERVLVGSGDGLSPLDYSEDGRYFLYSTSAETTGWDIWALPLEGGAKAFPVLQTLANEEFAQLSRDGKWIAYQSNESGRTEVYVRSFLQDGTATSVSSGGGIAPRWRRDGKELFYIGRDGGLMSVALHESADHKTLEPSGRTRLFRVPIAGGGSMLIGGVQQYAVAPDGQRILINMTISEDNPPITVVLNWPAAVGK